MNPPKPGWRSALKTLPVALSIRQPWAWLIIHAGKDIENRTWYGHYRGPLLIHAGKGMTRQEYSDCQVFVWDSFAETIALPAFGDLQRGGLIGHVEIVDCVTESQSSWFQGPYGFVLKNPCPRTFTPCLGSLGFFNVPSQVEPPFCSP